MTVCDTIAQLWTPCLPLAAPILAAPCFICSACLQEPPNELRPHHHTLITPPSLSPSVRRRKLPAVTDTSTVDSPSKIERWFRVPLFCCTPTLQPAFTPRVSFTSFPDIYQMLSFPNIPLPLLPPLLLHLPLSQCFTKSLMGPRMPNIVPRLPPDRQSRTRSIFPTSLTPHPLSFTPRRTFLP
jgi:hypothetical protein